MGESIPERLYHYTSPAGLIGIVSSRTVWATVMHYLNDAKEFQKAIEIAHGILYNTSADAADVASVVQACAELDEALERVSRVHVCIFSLTEQKDLLSQWRGYCPAAGGYSIGFDTSPLIEA